MAKKPHKVSPDVFSHKDIGSESVESLKMRISELEEQLCELDDKELNPETVPDYFEDIFETVGEGIALTTLRGKVLAINRNLETMIGVPSTRIVGRNILRIASDLLTADSLKYVLPILKNLVYGNDIEPFNVKINNRVLEVSANINLNTRRLTGTVRDRTESIRTEDALTKSELRLRRAELASRSGNWELNLDMKRIQGSQGAMKLYGFDIPEIDYNEAKEVPLPQYRAMLDKALKELVEEGKPYNLEFKIRNRKTGEILDIHSISEYDPKTRTVFGALQDITDRKRAEEETKAKSRDLEKLLEISMDLLETVDRKKVYERIVMGTPGLIGMESGALYMIDGDDIYLQATHPPLPPDLPEEFRRARLDNHNHIKKAVLTKSQVILSDSKAADLSPEERVITEGRNLRSLIYIPLFAAKEVVGVLIFGTIGIQRNFTEHEKRMCITLSNMTSLALENSLLIQNLTIAKEKAEESDKLKTAFLHNISHEIRTPLNAIIGFSGFLDQPDLSEHDRKDYIDIIFQSNNQLLTIINDILNISQIETGQTIICESRTDISQVVRNLHRQFLNEARRTGLDFRLNAGTGKQDHIYTDETKLIQILSNLLSNAFKFTHSGYVELGYSLKEDLAEFYVEDSGIGIHEAEQSKIFERFYQVDKKITRLYSGTGLGLSISNAYVGMLGGAFTVKSSPGKGSRFSFTIPLKNPSVGKDAEKETQVSASLKEPSGSTILVAEDEESNFALVKAMLKPYGYNLIRARNGKDAVDICLANPGIDLVLMDIKMPVMDGFEAAQEILKHRPGMRIVAQTAYAHPCDCARAIETGCVDYISKPFDRNRLVDIIRKYLN